MAPTDYPPVLSAEQVAQYHEDGFLCLRGFYDLAAEVAPIQHGIHQIIGALIRKCGLPVAQLPFQPATFDSGYQELIAHDRKIGGEVYDAVKQIPAFVRLAACAARPHGWRERQDRHDGVVRLRGGAFRR